MSNPRDKQRKRVYDWERAAVWGAWWQPPTAQQDGLPLAICARLVRRVFKDHGFPPPAVKDGRGRRSACGSRYLIRLPRWARQVEVVLHEVAHGLTDHYAPEEAGHGRTFVGIYIYLLDRYAKRNATQLLSTAREAGLEVNAQAACEFRGWRNKQ